MRALIWIGLAVGIAVFFPSIGAFMLNSPFVALAILLLVVLTFLGELEEE